MDSNFLSPSFLSACKELGKYIKFIMGQPCPFIFQNLTMGDVVLGTFAISIIIEVAFQIMEGDRN